MRWPWTRTEPEQDDVRALRASVSDLQADVRRLNAEWVDMYDKLVRRDERLRRREERAAAVVETPADGKASLWARAQANGHRRTR